MSSVGEQRYAGELRRWGALEPLIVPQKWLPKSSSNQHEEYIPLRPWMLEADRTFDSASDSTSNSIKFTLYRDRYYWCPYCQRVQLQLELKRVPYRIQMINMNCYGSKPREFLSKVPSGLLPVLEVHNADGTSDIVTESMDIMLLLEDLCPAETSLLSIATNTAASALGSQEAVSNFARECLQAERQLAGAWLNYLRGNNGRNFSNRGAQLAFESALDQVEHLLSTRSESRWFLGGAQPSLIKCVYAPFLERVEATMLYFRGSNIRAQRPRLAAWFDAMDELSLYRNSKSDVRTHARALPPQIGRCLVAPNAEKVAQTIELRPTRSLLGAVPPPVALCVEVDSKSATVNTTQEKEKKKELDEARMEAAGALLANWSAVVRDALSHAHSAEKRGGVFAALNKTMESGSDKRSEDVELALGAAFRAAVRLLTSLERIPSGREEPRVLADAAVEFLAEEMGALNGANVMQEEVKSALKFARERVCTPRDMRILAADQYQGALNAVIAGLDAMS
eukprot:CAMPEP_0185837318 /NCGR_PEP_ID=MMETSP1353-20130828/11184_1 /TAXON_ID=1077150 /ORGANISM="Erythrolobus australicus, Strain CCMP3124" /LENGTH=509 /DNA_ID=CAMNT_0028536219 /DNA_START=225 /DNA_END=1754 /DNA_ORIENTATION=-